MRCYVAPSCHQNVNRGWPKAIRLIYEVNQHLTEGPKVPRDDVVIDLKNIVVNEVSLSV